MSLYFFDLTIEQQNKAIERHRYDVFNGANVGSAMWSYRTVKHYSGALKKLGINDFVLDLAEEGKFTNDFSLILNIESLNVVDLIRQMGSAQKYEQVLPLLENHEMTNVVFMSGYDLINEKVSLKKLVMQNGGIICKYFDNIECAYGNKEHSQQIKEIKELILSEIKSVFDKANESLKELFEIYISDSSVEEYLIRNYFTFDEEGNTLD